MSTGHTYTPLGLFEKCVNILMHLPPIPHVHYNDRVDMRVHVKGSAQKPKPNIWLSRSFDVTTTVGIEVIGPTIRNILVDQFKRHNIPAVAVTPEVMQVPHVPFSYTQWGGQCGIHVDWYALLHDRMFARVTLDFVRTNLTEASFEHMLIAADNCRR